MSYELPHLDMSPDKSSALSDIAGVGSQPLVDPKTLLFDKSWLKLLAASVGGTDFQSTYYDYI